MAIGVIKEGSEEYFTALDIMACCKKPANSTDGDGGSGMFEAAICLMLANHESSLQVLIVSSNGLYKYLYQQDSHWLKGKEVKIENEKRRIFASFSTNDDKRRGKAEIATITTKLFLIGNKNSNKKGVRQYLREINLTANDGNKTYTADELNNIKDVGGFYKIMKACYIDGMYAKPAVRNKDDDKEKTSLDEAVAVYNAKNFGAIGRAVALTQGWVGAKENQVKKFITREIDQDFTWARKLEIALDLIKNNWDKVVSRTESKNIDTVTDTEAKQVSVKVDDTERKTSGIWKLFNLDFIDNNVDDGNYDSKDGFAAIKKLRINDISYASSIGSFMNLFNKINQEPFVQNFGNSGDQRYHRTIRLSPFTKSLWKQLGYYTVDKTNVYSDNLFWETDYTYSWYRLIPSGNFWGDTSNVLEYLPAVFFPEYAELFGSKPLDVTCNYVNYEAQGRNTIESSLKLLRFMVECHAYMPFTRKGEIKITYSPRIRIGQRLRYLPTGEMFYIDSVKHFANYGNTPNAYTIVKVSRGMLEDVDDYFNIIVFDEEVEKKTYKTPPPADGKFIASSTVYKSFYFNDNISEFDVNIVPSGDSKEANLRSNIDQNLNYIAASFINCLKSCRATAKNAENIKNAKFDRMIIAGDSKNDSYYRYMRYSDPEKPTLDGWQRVQKIGSDLPSVKDAKYYISSEFYKRLVNAYGDFKDKSVLVSKTLSISYVDGRKNESLKCPYFVFYNLKNSEIGKFEVEVRNVMNECVTLNDSKYAFDSDLFKLKIVQICKLGEVDIENTISLNKTLGEFHLDKYNEQAQDETPSVLDNPEKTTGVVNYKTLLSQPSESKKKPATKIIDTNKYSNESVGTDYVINLESIKTVGRFLISLIDRYYGVEEGVEKLNKPITIYSSSSSEGIKDSKQNIDAAANNTLAENRRIFVIEQIRRFCENDVDKSLDKYKAFGDYNSFANFFDFRDVVTGKRVCDETDEETAVFAKMIDENYSPPESKTQFPNYNSQFVKPLNGDWLSVNKAMARFHHEFRGVRVHYNEYIPKPSEVDVDTETKSVEEVERRLKWYVDKKIFRNLLAKRHYGIKEKYDNTNGRN